MDNKLLGHPGLLSNYYRFGDRLSIPDNCYFVFGSNTRGVHGAGAAKFAAKYFGAKFGKGKGYTGQCYAIPTKDDYLRVLPLNKIEEYVKEFVSATDIATLESDPEKQSWFYVTPIGTRLAGYDHSEIAPLFQGAANCWFPDIWKPYLGEQPGIRKEYQNAK